MSVPHLKKMNLRKCQNIHARYIQYIYIYTFHSKMFNKRIGVTYFYLMVCFPNVKDVWCKKKPGSLKHGRCEKYGIY